MGTKDGVPSASNPESLGPFALLLNAATVSPSIPQPYTPSRVAYEHVPRRSEYDYRRYSPQPQEERRRDMHQLPSMAQLPNGIIPKRSPSPEQQQPRYSAPPPCVVSPQRYPRLPSIRATLPPIQPPRCPLPPHPDHSPLAMLSAAAEYGSASIPVQHPRYSPPPPPIYSSPYHPHHLQTAYVPRSPIPQAHQTYHIQPVAISSQPAGKMYVKPEDKPVPQFAPITHSLSRRSPPMFEPYRGMTPPVESHVHYPYERPPPPVMRSSVKHIPHQQVLPSPSELISGARILKKEIDVMPSDAEIQREGAKPREDEYDKKEEDPTESDESKEVEPEIVEREEKDKEEDKKVPEDKVESEVKGLPDVNVENEVVPEERLAAEEPVEERPKEQETDDEAPLIPASATSPRNGRVEDDDDEETRCPCNSMVNEGFMIACDDCDTWQHGRCMGFRRRSDAPEKYYCHLCRPGAVRKGSRAHTFVAKKREEHYQLLSDIEIPELRRKLAHALVQQESKRWKTRDKWLSHVFRTFASLLRSNFKNERQSVVSGLSLALNMKDREVDGKLKYGTKRLRKNAAKALKHESQTAPGSERMVQSPKKTHRKSLSEPGRRSKKRIWDFEKRFELQSGRRDDDDDCAREDEFDLVPAKRNTPVETNVRKSEAQSCEHLSREERKIQQIMKQFERLEQQKHRRKGSSHTTGKSVRQDSGSSSVRANGRTNKAARKERSSASKEEKHPKESDKQKHLPENDIVLDEGRPSDASCTLQAEEEKVGSKSETSDVERQTFVQRGTTKDKTAMNDMEVESAHISEADFDQGERGSVSPQRRRPESTPRSRVRPILTYNRASSAERELVDENGREALSPMSGIAWNQESEGECRRLKRPRLSLNIPSPGPSVLGSVLIPDELRSPLVDVGCARKHPRLMDRKTRLLRTPSDYELPTKKKILLSSANPKKKSKLPISPSALPCTFGAKDEDRLGVGMIMVNVNKELGEDYDCPDSNLDGRCSPSPLRNGSAVSLPDVQLRKGEDKGDELPTSTCSSPDKEPTESTLSAAEETRNCLKKRPRLRLEPVQETNVDATRSPDPMRSPIRSSCSTPLRSPRLSMLRGLRSVPIRSPAGGPKTPILRSAPCRSPVLRSAPAPSLSPTLPAMLRFAKSPGGVPSSDGGGRRKRLKNLEFGALETLTPKKRILLSPRVATTYHRESYAASSESSKETVYEKEEDGESSTGEVEEESMTDIPVEKEISALRSTPRPKKDATKDIAVPRFFSVPRTRPSMLSSDRRLNVKNGSGPAKEESEAASPTTAPNGNENTSPGKTGITSPSDILQQRLRGFLKKRTNEDEPVKDSASAETKPCTLPSVPRQGEKPAPVAPGGNDVRRSLENNRNAKRGGFGHRRAFSLGGQKPSTSQWNGGYRSNRFGYHSNGPGRGFRGGGHAGHINGGRVWRNGRRFGGDGNGNAGNGGGGHLNGSGATTDGPRGGSVGPYPRPMFVKGGPGGPGAWRTYREQRGWVGNPKDRRVAPNGDVKHVRR